MLKGKFIDPNAPFGRDHLEFFLNQTLKETVIAKQLLRTVAEDFGTNVVLEAQAEAVTLILNKIGWMTDYVGTRLGYATHGIMMGDKAEDWFFDWLREVNDEHA